MTWAGRSIVGAFTLLACLGTIRAELIDDRAIRIHRRSDVEAARQKLVQHLWGAEGFPSRRMPASVATNVPSPVRHLTSLSRVDALSFELSPGLSSLAYHFIPAKPNRALVVVHHGHACTLDDDPAPTETGYGLQRTIHALLKEGYGVLGVFMPHMRPGDCTGGHAEIFNLRTSGNPMKFFFEPVAISLNYLASKGGADRFPRYREFHMAGLSGGGWTTTVYAAIDPRIRQSFSVAGTLPLYLRYGGSVGDLEQFEPSFYTLAGYPDLYLLGSAGRGRKQVQIVNRKDDCCFGERQHDAGKAGAGYDEALRSFERRVQSAGAEIGNVSFKLEIDEVAPSHMISHHALGTIILPSLRKARGGSMTH